MYSKYVTREYLILFTYRNSIFIYLLTGIKAIILIKKHFGMEIFTHRRSM